MKRSLIALLIVVLSACQPAVNTSSPKTSPNSVPVGTATMTGTATQTILPTTTFTPSTTSTPTVTLWPSRTPTPFPPREFDPAGVTTVTPAQPAVCPQESNADLEFKLFEASLNANTELNIFFRDYVLTYLNSGGSIRKIMGGGYASDPDRPGARYLDVTGDGVPELIYAFGIWLDVFGCNNAKYELMAEETYDSANGGIYIIDATDMNLNGLPDIVVYFSGCGGSKCPIIYVFEWNGAEFEDLTGGFDGNCTNVTVAPFTVDVKDIDKNGTKEIIFENNGMILSDIDFPPRHETKVCMWNGQQFEVDSIEFDAPHYRFQAVQDGDRASFNGDYKKALKFYEQAIEDKKLVNFNNDRKWYDFFQVRSKYYSLTEPTPTKSPLVEDGAEEYANLKAYSQFRMMLVYLQLGEADKAAEVFAQQQAEFSAGQPGEFFAEMARVFVQSYDSDADMGGACQKVIEFGLAEMDMLYLLGDWDHGAQSIWYHYDPDMLCPFR